jgi:hypothetical protein
MNKILKALTAASAAMLASGGALASMPYSGPFGGDGFGVDDASLSIVDGVVSVACPASAVTCINYEGGNGADGILQRRVVMPDGTSYLQSILAQGDVATSLFASEQVVRMGVNGGGNSTNIAQKLKIFEAGNGASDFYSADHTMLGCEYYGTGQGDTACAGGQAGGQDLLFALDQLIHEAEPGNAMDQLTRIVGEITGTGGDLNGNGGGAEGAKRVGIDQWHTAATPGTGTPNAAGFFVYRTGQDTGTVIDLEDPNADPLALSGYNSSLVIQNRQTADTGLMFHRVTADIANSGSLQEGGVLTRTEITGTVTGPWDWNGTGADIGGAITDIFGSYTDQTSSALDLWQ